MAAVLGRGLTKGLGGITGANHLHGLGEVYDEENHRKRCLNSKFAAYYVVTITLNGVAVLSGMLSQCDFHYSRHSAALNQVDSWYLANALFGIIHILAAIYIVYKIEQPIKAAHTTTTKGSRGLVPAGYHANNHHNIPSFDYNQFDGEAPPPPQNPNYIQAHEVMVVPMDKSRNAAAPRFPHAPPRMPPMIVTEPCTTARMKRVLCEDKIVAVYILIFFLYLSWHYFMDFQHLNYSYYRGMLFVMRCADIFIMAGPASLVFCCVYTIATGTSA